MPVVVVVVLWHDFTHLVQVKGKQQKGCERSKREQQVHKTSRSRTLLGARPHVKYNREERLDTGTRF